MTTCTCRHAVKHLRKPAAAALRWMHRSFDKTQTACVQELHVAKSILRISSCDRTRSCWNLSQFALDQRYQKEYASCSKSEPLLMAARRNVVSTSAKCPQPFQTHLSSRTRSLASRHVAVLRRRAPCRAAADHAAQSSRKSRDSRSRPTCLTWIDNCVDLSHSRRTCLLTHNACFLRICRPRRWRCVKLVHVDNARLRRAGTSQPSVSNAPRIRRNCLSSESCRQLLSTTL
mmetsp:Transcript_64542/g.154181  ORF Transcript_64542/g.154181 Transcript_64542/m.154181 type:complete len:231 (-) Transcript_64542:190-882(-)